MNIDWMEEKNENNFHISLKLSNAMSVEDLQSSLLQYETQLNQIQDALKNSSNDDTERDSLQSLSSDLCELIALTKENIEKLIAIHQPTKIENVHTESHQDTAKDPFEEEYALFLSEMSKSGAYDEEDKKNLESKSQCSSSSSTADIKEELASLEGVKCAVLFYHKWGGEPSLHNAMVCSVVKDDPDEITTFDAIKVRIMFTNPTHTEMIPCPYFLNGDCKFDDESCRFSHGEIFLLSSLKEAIEPNFSSLKIGSKVLAKIEKQEEASGSKVSENYLLWHRSIIIGLDCENHTCTIKLENNVLFKDGKGNNYEIDFGNIFPLTDSDSDSEGESDIQEDEINFEARNDDFDYMINKSLSTSSVEHLGDWEKHTKGIGSKLLKKMGYIIGTGLGPRGDGIMQPVPCSVLPVGRSLDHCMNTKLECWTDPGEINKKALRKQRKEEERNKRASERAKEREKHDVFNFLNETLSSKCINNQNTNNVSNKLKTCNGENVKSSSCKNLNIEQFQLTENIRKIEKEISKLQQSLERNNSNQDIKNQLTLRLKSKLNDMKELKMKEMEITKEQNIRKDKKKISIF